MGNFFSNIVESVTKPFEQVGNWVEKTFLPENVKETISDIPILGDALSRGWLGPVAQQFTNEGKDFYNTEPSLNNPANWAIPALAAIFGAPYIAGGTSSGVGDLMNIFGLGGSSTGTSGAGTDIWSQLGNIFGGGGTSGTSGGLGNVISSIFGGGGGTTGTTSSGWLTQLLPQLFSTLGSSYLTQKQNTEQYKYINDLMAPYRSTANQLGGVIQNQLTEPLQLPESYWDEVWNKSKEATTTSFEPIYQKASERAASSGMLGQGPTNQLFTDIDISKAKTIEQQSVDQALSEWNAKLTANQNAINNAMKYVGGAGSAVNYAVPPPTTDYSGLTDLGLKLTDLWTPKNNNTNIVNLLTQLLKNNNANDNSNFNPIEDEIFGNLDEIFA